MLTIDIGTWYSKSFPAWGNIRVILDIDSRYDDYELSQLDIWMVDGSSFRQDATKNSQAPRMIDSVLKFEIWNLGTAEATLTSGVGVIYSVSRMSRWFLRLLGKAPRQPPSSRGAPALFVGLAISWSSPVVFSFIIIVFVIVVVIIVVVIVIYISQRRLQVW